MTQDCNNGDEITSFQDMGLDERIVQAISDRLKWESPTAIQEQAIPLVLAGRDVLVRSRTGSGKTAVFSLPAVQQILHSKVHAKEQNTRCLVLGPTRELCRQIENHFRMLTSACVSSGHIQIVNTCGSQDDDSNGIRTLLKDRPDIVIGTPLKVATFIRDQTLKNMVENLEFLIIDEADLILSFGHTDDISFILSSLGHKRHHQTILTSATLTEDVMKLKSLSLKSPVILKLEEPPLPQVVQLKQYKMMLEEEDKFLLIFSLLKLNLIQGKSIIFVNDVDRCYRVKLFLEQFAIKVCVLNSELPAESRYHTLTQFNAGVYNIVIASDEKFLETDETGEVIDDSNKKSTKKVLAKSKRKRDKDSGVVRGIDFQFVSNIINFDFPQDFDCYVHRVGRTARGNRKGTSLSFVASKEFDRFVKVENQLKSYFFGGEDEENDSGSNEDVMKPYKFKMEQINGFRYRVKDAMRSVTRIAIREARLKEIKQEMLNSNKLCNHFDENPRDLKTLRHDKEAHTIKKHEHMTNVPEYILPSSLKSLAKNVASKKKNDRKRKQNFSGNSANRRRFVKRKGDPLLTT